MRKIDRLLDEARALALAEVERRARTIMARNPRCASFCMAMGSFSFYDKAGEPIGDWGPLPVPKYLDPFYRFISDYDCLGLTGTPIKIEGATGPRVSDW